MTADDRRLILPVEEPTNVSEIDENSTNPSTEEQSKNIENPYYVFNLDQMKEPTEDVVDNEKAGKYKKRNITDPQEEEEGDEEVESPYTKTFENAFEYMKDFGNNLNESVTRVTTFGNMVSSLVGVRDWFVRLLEFLPFISICLVIIALLRR